MARTVWAGVILIGLTAPASAGDPDGGLRIGMVQGMFRDIQPAMVQAMSLPLRDMIQRQTGLTGDVAIIPDAQTLAAGMAAQRYQLGVFHGFEFAWVRKQHPELVPLAVTVPPGRKLRACIIVHKDSPAAGLADLKDEAVVVPRGTKAHCLAYLGKQREGLPESTAKPRTKPAVTAEQALDAVVQGDVAAALVDIGALNGYQNLQPGAHKQLRILCQSEFFPQTVIAYRKGSVSEATAGKVRRLLTEANTTAAGKPLMMLWNLKGFEDVPADYDAQLDRIAQSYPAPSVVGRPVLRPVGVSDMEK